MGQVTVTENAILGRAVRNGLCVPLVLPAAATTTAAGAGVEVRRAGAGGGGAGGGATPSETGSGGGGAQAEAEAPIWGLLYCTNKTEYGTKTGGSRDRGFTKEDAAVAMAFGQATAAAAKACADRGAATAGLLRQAGFLFLSLSLALNVSLVPWLSLLLTLSLTPLLSFSLSLSISLSISPSLLSLSRSRHATYSRLLFLSVSWVLFDHDEPHRQL